jgi:hypothetical protein
VHQHYAVGAEVLFDTIEPQHRPALPLSDWFARLPAIDIFAGRIDRTRPALGLFPVVLKRAAAAILRLVDLVMTMQTAQRIVSDRTQGDDLFAGLDA